MNADRIWLLDKPTGIGSRNLVDLAVKKTRIKGLGHTGTLDPHASGLLILVGGNLKKLQEFFTTLPKTYDAVIELGAETETDDQETPPVPYPNAVIPSKDELERALATLVGEIRQKPPAYSAVKIHGERAYKLARAGQEVKLPERTVRIYEIKLHEYAYPTLSLTIRCSAGTYIRTLARDLGVSLSVGGYLKALRRVTVGSFEVRDALQPEQLAPNTGLSLEQTLIPYPRLDLPLELWQKLANGQRLRLTQAIPQGHLFVWVTGCVVAIATGEDNFLIPKRLIKEL